MADTTVEISNTAPVGQAAMAASNPVTIASDQTAVPVTISGTPTVSGAVSVSNFPATQPVSGTVTANLGTIATVSTAAKQDAQTTALGLLALESGGVLASILAKIAASPALDATVSAGNTLLTAIKALLPTALGASGGIKVDGSGTALPVSGTVTATVSGVALEAGHLATIDTSTASSAAAQATTNTRLAGGLPAALGGGGGVKVDGSGTALPVSVAALPALTTGSATIGAVTGPGAAALATSAAQTTAQTSLTSIDGKMPALGQALAAGAVPVVLTAIQVTALAQDRTVATAAAAVRVSDGTNFVDSTHPLRTDPTGTTAQPITDNGGSLTIDSAQLPSALAANGGIKIEGVASGVAVPVSIATVPSHAVTVAQLPSALGQQTGANSTSFVTAKSTGTTLASVATAGQSLKGSAGTAYAIEFYNNTGGSVACMVFDASSTRSNGSVPLWGGALISTGGQSVLTLGGNVGGLPFSTDLWVQFSSTLVTLTSIASTAITATYVGV